MGGIHVQRWIMGGLAAAAVIFLAEGVSGTLYLEDMTAAMEAHGLTFDMGGGAILLSVLLSLIAGLVLVFLYAAARPRFGPGPRTAVIVGLAMWFGGYLLTIIGYSFLGLFPTSMLVLWAVVGLVELPLAAVVGAWLYREGEATAEM